MELHASASRTVPATPDEVFDLITSVDRLPEWNADLPKVVQPGLLCDEGDEWVMEIHALGSHWNSRSTVIERDPNPGAPVRLSGPAKRRRQPVVCALDVGVDLLVDEGTRISVRWSLRPRTFWRKALFARIRHRQLRGEVATSLRALQSMVR